MNFLKSVKFILVHPWVCLAAVLLGFFLNWALGRYPGKPMRRVWMLWSLLGLFYVGAYLTRPVYYEEYHGGSRGDNYLSVRAGVNIDNFLVTQHFYFPWVPAQLFKAAIRMKFFSLDDPMIMEKAYPFFSLPNRLLAFLGFLLMAGILRLAGRSSVESALGAWLLAVSFGYWFWALQSNAMSLCLLMILLSLYLTILALQKETPWLYALAGLATALLMYVHISAVYVCLGITAAIVGISIHRTFVQKRSNVWSGPILFGATAAILGAIYYSMVSSYYHTTSPSLLLNFISDYGSLGKFHFNGHFIQLIFQDGAIDSLALLLGMHQTEGKSIVELMVIALQLGLMGIWVISLIRLPWKKMMTLEDDLPFWVAAAVFASCVLGYAIRKTWLQYYAPITPAFVLLVLLVAYSRKETRFAWPVSLILCTMFINGFSSAKVFAGEHLMDHPEYRRFSKLEGLWPAKPVIYVDGMMDYDHNFIAIMNYYESRGHFSNISWIQPVSLEKLSSLLKVQQSDIALNATLYPALAAKNNFSGHPIEHRHLDGPEPVDLIVFPVSIKT